jgi:hypothetical protein
MACSVNAFAKLSTAKSASFDDIRKGNLHINENIFCWDKRASQTISAECDQQFYYKKLSNEKCAALAI